MYDVVVLYTRPADPAAFDEHYTRVHVPLVQAMPLVAEFAWGRVDSAQADAPYVVARMTYRSAEDAAASLSGPEGQAAVADLQRFAQAGVQVLNAPRVLTWP
ncbi:EthD family reductase [Geodermatophilus sp. SYSU D00742]